MRIKWNSTEIEEVKLIDFTEGYDPEADERHITFNGLDFASDEWQYWGEVAIEYFESYDKAVAWCKKVIDEMLIKGYLDLSTCKEILLY